MTTVERPQSGQRFRLCGISWETYVALRDVPENQHVRMTFDRGDLEMRCTQTVPFFPRFPRLRRKRFFGKPAR